MAAVAQRRRFQQSDWENFMILLPGSSGTYRHRQQASTNPGQAVSSNGNLPLQQHPCGRRLHHAAHSQNANPAVFEDVAEATGILSSFSAQYGIGGMIINQITKGGTSQFHGLRYDYFQNNAFDAATFGFGNEVTVPFLRYDNFGGTVGGPVPFRVEEEGVLLLRLRPDLDKASATATKPFRRPPS